MLNRELKTLPTVTETLGNRVGIDFVKNRPQEEEASGAILALLVGGPGL